jgi:hypothetical protein
MALLDIHEFGPPGWKDGDPLPSAMLNYQVADGEAETARLRAGGAEVMQVHSTGYINAYVAIDGKYHNVFCFIQLKDDAVSRQIFMQMQAGAGEH